MCMSSMFGWHSRSCLNLIIITIIFLFLHISIFAAADDHHDHDHGGDDKSSVHNVSIKCGECPCVNPCNQLLPPPSPSPPPPAPATSPPPKYCPPEKQPPPQPQTPPPPRFIYYTGLPQQSNNNIPPPPPPRFSYVTGPPGNLYPSDPFNLEIYSKASTRGRNNNILFVGCGLLQMLLVSWGLF